MGFQSKKENTYPYGIKYVEGAPLTVKFNGKDGMFVQLGEKYGESSIQVQILKDVQTPKLVVYPFKDNQAPQQMTVVFYRNLETDEICTGLFKTYSEGNFTKLQAEISAYSKAQGKDFDYTDFEITMSWIPVPEGKRGYFQIQFTFCKDKDGNPVRYRIDNGKELSINDKAIPQHLPKESYERSAKFFSKICKSGELLYDLRFADEVVRRNVKTDDIAPSKQAQLPILALYRANFFSEDTAKAIVNSTNQLQLA